MAGCLSLALLPALPQELQLNALLASGDWVKVVNHKGKYLGDWSWQVQTNDANRFKEVLLTLRYKEREVLNWTGLSGEQSRALWIYRDRRSPRPRFLCHQSLTSATWRPFGHTLPRRILRGTWLIDGGSIRPVVTNPVSLLIRDPIALFGWGDEDLPGPGDMKPQPEFTPSFSSL